MDHFPLDLMRSFVALARTGSFTRAGEEVGRSQAALSLQIQRLEEMAGVKLIDRASRPMRPTARGEVLLTYARQILALSSRCMAEIRGQTLSGQLNVGLPNDFAISFFPRVLSRFVDVHPGVSMEVTSDLSRGLVRQFGRSEFDMMLSLVGEESDVEPARRWSEPVSWVSAQGGPPRGEGPLRLVLYPDGCHYRSRALTRLSDAGQAHRVVYSGSSLSGIQAAVESGLGLTVLSRNTIPPALRAVAPSAENGLPELGEVTVGLFRPKRHRNASARELCDFMEQALDERYGPGA